MDARTVVGDPGLCKVRQEGLKSVVELLDPFQAATMRSQSFTYSEIGATALGAPSGYSCFSRSVILSPAIFESAQESLMSWQLQSRAGIRVAASSVSVERDAVVRLTLQLGPVSIIAPCRVVYVVNEPHRRGFAYGTLPGHPESGEESFILSRAGTGQTLFEISAFSRPATLPAKAAGPIGRAIQRRLTARYLRAISL